MIFYTCKSPSGISPKVKCIVNLVIMNGHFTIHREFVFVCMGLLYSLYYSPGAIGREKGKRTDRDGERDRERLNREREEEEEER